MHDHNHDEHHHHAPDPADGSAELATCPVMDMPVNKKDAEKNGLTRNADGQTYYFCCNTCARQFDEQY